MILANLDCEAVWARERLPLAVRQLISAAGTLMRVYAEEGEALWTPVPVSPARLAPHPDLPTPRLVSSARPSDARLAWADAEAAPFNHRRFGLETARALGVALPGARMVTAMPATPDPAWVLKPPHSAAGRGQIRGAGPPRSETARRVARAFRAHGELLYEPWLARTADFGCCRDRPPHTLLVDADGAFRGIAHPAGLSGEERALLLRVRDGAVDHLTEAGYHGPLTIDAFRHEALHPLCEINARLTFGALAAALRERLGLHGPSTLRLSRRPPPTGAIVLLLSAPPDGLGAWFEVGGG